MNTAKTYLKLISFAAALYIISNLSTASVSLATEYVYCKGNSSNGDAYLDDAKTVPADSDLQYICGLPEDDPAQPRCPIAIKSVCQIGSAGGDGGIHGRHNVPSWAWFEAISNRGSGTQVKCRCGCFAPETAIWTEYGEVGVEDLLGLASRQSVAPMVRTSLDQVDAFAASAKLRSHQFTVGPEAKPLVVVRTAHGEVVRLTDNHPVLVERFGQQVFLRADELTSGDLLFDRGGRLVAVTALESAQLKADQKVINFASDAKNPLAHIVVAGGLQVGDHLWQQAINDEAARKELRKTGSLYYLKQIVNQ